jgi:hypothetical protein
MKIKINSVECSYGLECAKEHIKKALITDQEWYQYEHPNFDLVRNYEDVKAICDQNAFCWLDSFNWSIMNTTELTSSLYKFVTYHTNVIKQGIESEFMNFILYVPMQLVNFSLGGI